MLHFILLSPSNSEGASSVIPRRYGIQSTHRIKVIVVSRIVSGVKIIYSNPALYLCSKNAQRELKIHREKNNCSSQRSYASDNCNAVLNSESSLVRYFMNDYRDVQQALNTEVSKLIGVIFVTLSAVFQEQSLLEVHKSR